MDDDLALEQIRNLLQANPDSPLAQLLRASIASSHASLTSPAPTTNMQHPAAAMQALVGLLRATSRDSMQLAILQLHHARQP